MKWKAEELLGRQGEQKWIEVGILWLGLDSGMAKRVSLWLHAQDEKFPSMRWAIQRHVAHDKGLKQWSQS